jgi:hypothetical protein
MERDPTSPPATIEATATVEATVYPLVLAALLEAEAAYATQTDAGKRVRAPDKASHAWNSTRSV